MTIWSRFLSILVPLLLAAACVATGTKEITDSGRTARLEADKSTKAEVSALLGFPAIVTYGKEGQETWEYYYVTEYPQVAAFVPVVDALAENFSQNTKVLTVTFDRQGVARNLARRQASGSAAVYPY